MKIYTKTGDLGQTKLGNGTTVAKSDCLIESLGVVDECNAFLGVLLTEIESEPDLNLLRRAQSCCMYIGAVIAQSSPVVLAQLVDHCSVEDVAALEERIDTITDILPPLTNFILPGGNRVAADSHLARAWARRLEREVNTLSTADPMNGVRIRQYCNRLSDYLFVLGRWCNYQAGLTDIIWRGRDQSKTKV